MIFTQQDNAHPSNEKRANNKSKDSLHSKRFINESLSSNRVKNKSQSSCHSLVTDKALDKLVDNKNTALQGKNKFQSINQSNHTALGTHVQQAVTSAASYNDKVSSNSRTMSLKSVPSSTVIPSARFSFVNVASSKEGAVSINSNSLQLAGSHELTLQSSPNWTCFSSAAKLTQTSVSVTSTTNQYNTCLPSFFSLSCAPASAISPINCALRKEQLSSSVCQPMSTISSICSVKPSPLSAKSDVVISAFSSSSMFSSSVQPTITNSSPAYCMQSSKKSVLSQPINYPPTITQESCNARHPSPDASNNMTVGNNYRAVTYPPRTNCLPSVKPSILLTSPALVRKEMDVQSSKIKNEISGQREFSVALTKSQLATDVKEIDNSLLNGSQCNDDNFERNKLWSERDWLDQSIQKTNTTKIISSNNHQHPMCISEQLNYNNIGNTPVCKGYPKYSISNVPVYSEYSLCCENPLNANVELGMSDNVKPCNMLNLNELREKGPGLADNDFIRNIIHATSKSTPIQNNQHSHTENCEKSFSNHPLEDKSFITNNTRPLGEYDLHFVHTSQDATERLKQAAYNKQHSSTVDDRNAISLPDKQANCSGKNINLILCTFNILLPLITLNRKITIIFLPLIT